MDKQRLTSFQVDEDVFNSLRFKEAKKKRGFLKSFLNSALRKAFVEEIVINEGQ